LTTTTSVASSSVSETAIASKGRICLFGEFAVQVDGQPRTLSPDAQRLVAFLALQTDRLPRTLVAGTLWFASSQERAFGNLRSAIWRLRQQAESVLDVDAHNVGIASGVSVDVHETARTAARLLNVREECPIEDCAAGPFLKELLPGWYDEWVLFERERLHQQSVYALEAIASRLASLGHYGAAIQAALHAIRMDPLRESAHRCLIQIHIEEGNQSEAVRHYGTYESLLSKELGLTPSRRMTDLIP